MSEGGGVGENRPCAKTATHTAPKPTFSGKNGRKEVRRNLFWNGGFWNNGPRTSNITRFGPPQVRARYFPPRPCGACARDGRSPPTTNPDKQAPDAPGSGQEGYFYRPFPEPQASDVRHNAADGNISFSPKRIMANLFLGLDCSTQSFTALLLEQTVPGDPSSTRILMERSLNFDEHFPEFGTRNGVLLGQD